MKQTKPIKQTKLMKQIKPIEPIKLMKPIQLLILFLFLPTTIFAAEKSFSATVPSTLQKYKQDKIFIVDTRPKNDFNNIRIPGSLNFSIHEIKTKPFLKTKPIVLANNGFSTSLLKQECQRLNQMGFNASVLTGGLNAWKYRQGPLEGDLSAARSFKNVSPEEFQMENINQNIVIIDATKTKHEKKRFPKAIQLSEAKLMDQKSPSTQPTKPIKQIQPTKQIKQIKPNSTILVISNNGSYNDRVEKILSDQNLGPLFVLEGGLDAYNTYIDNLSLSRKPRDARLQTIGSCNQCGKEGDDGEKQNAGG